MGFLKKSNFPINNSESSNKKVKNNDILKLEEKIEQEKLEIKDTFTEIGKLYFELYKNDSHEKLIPLCNVVDESYRIIGLCEKQILMLQGEQVCSSCKAHVSLDSIFCNKCGSKIDSLDIENNMIDKSTNKNTKSPEERNVFIKCRECGISMPDDIIFCTNCGAKIK